MFEDVDGITAPRRSIVLETRTGRRVSNRVGSPPDEYALRQATLIVEKYGENWERRKPPCGVYNCAGHVWASRRTGIYDWMEIRKILEDDGYEQLSHASQCAPDDLVLYISREEETWLHVGRVLGVEERGPSTRLKVLSKWGPRSGEFIHDEYDVHFSDKFDFDTIYYSDRTINQDQ